MGSPLAARYEILRTLQVGACSVTYLARHALTGAAVALREFRRDIPESNEAFERELAALPRTFHPFIACLYEVVDLGQFAYLSVECPFARSLRDFVRRRGQLPEAQARVIFMQLISALSHLHSELDDKFFAIRIENVTVDDNMSLKIGQFTTAGSLPAPEMIMERELTAAVTTWGLGALLFELVSGRPPFEDLHRGKLAQKILRSDPVFPCTVAPLLSDLLSRMLAKDPNERITLRNIMEHPWVREGDADRHLSAVERIRVLRNPAQSPLDQEIVSQVREIGVDTSDLQGNFARGVETAATAAYRVLLRAKMSEDVADALPFIGEERNANAARSVRGSPPWMSARRDLLADECALAKRSDGAARSVASRGGWL